MWDNLLSIFLLNLGFLLVLAAGLYLLSLTTNLVLFLITAVFALVALCVYTGIAAMMTRDMANYQSFEIQNVGPYLKETWKTSAAFALTILAQLIVFQFVMPWYLGQGKISYADGFAPGDRRLSVSRKTAY